MIIRTQLNVTLTDIPEDKSLWEDVYLNELTKEIIYCSRFTSYIAAAEKLQQVIGSFGEDAIKKACIFPIPRFISIPDFGTPISQLQK